MTPLSAIMLFEAYITSFPQSTHEYREGMNIHVIFSLAHQVEIAAEFDFNLLEPLSLIIFSSTSSNKPLES